MTIPRLTRRRLLRAGGMLAAGAAGCIAPVGSQDANPDGEFPAEVRDRARAVGERNRPAVVVLQPPDTTSSATAWFLEGGHLLTSAHVLDDLGGDLRGHTIDGTAFGVTVEHRSETPDLALLSAAIDPPATLPAGRSTELERGQPVVQIGHTRIGYWTVGLGAFRRRKRLPGRTWLLTEMPMALGNSGSPLLTLDGRAVGLTFGVVPKDEAPPSRDPTPAPLRVYEEYPRQAVRYGGHVASETVERYVGRWTGGASTSPG